MAISVPRPRLTRKCQCSSLDLDDREAEKLLALHDPLAGMAEANEEVLAHLLSQVETENDAVQSCSTTCSASRLCRRTNRKRIKEPP